ncbi:MAG TPA: dihydropteroate synthase [Ferruginibacter sp.]|nr:dihydropteroate synthase [Ferruginibacter sp.]
MFTLNCKGKLVTAERPMLMGILNITPDSFYDGHLHNSETEILNLAGKMIADGADILDIGGQSSRPGSLRIPVEEELNRVIPAIRALHKRFPETLLSIDTYQSEVAKAAVAEGVHIVNDISAGEMDAAMINVVSKLGVPYICMHMKGRPENMHESPAYDDVTREVLDYFIAKVEVCKTAGIQDIIIDPGFGFGKTISHNFRLLKDLASFKMLGYPILAGLSRKSTIYKTLKVTAAEALNGTTVLNTLALQNGADIVRVHDVKEAREAILLMEAYKKSAP